MVVLLFVGLWCRLGVVGAGLYMVSVCRLLVLRRFCLVPFLVLIVDCELVLVGFLFIIGGCVGVGWVGLFMVFCCLYLFYCVLIVLVRSASGWVVSMWVVWMVCFGLRRRWQFFVCV